MVTEVVMINRTSARVKLKQGDNVAGVYLLREEDRENTEVLELEGALLLMHSQQRDEEMEDISGVKKQKTNSEKEKDREKRK